MMMVDLGEQFRAAMRRFPSTVSVISTAKDGQRHGMTATAVTSVSLDPPSLLVCVNRRGRLFGMMESCHRFCVNVLHAEHVAISRSFAEPDCPDRFAYGEWHDNEHGIPYLLDAQAAMSCVKSLSVPHGSHTVFFGNVEEIKIREDISPLLYQNGGYGVCEPLWREADASLAQLVGWG